MKIFLINWNDFFSFMIFEVNWPFLQCLSTDWLVESARGYQLYGRPVAELCANNADVAERVGRHQVAQVWRIMGFICASTDNRNPKSGHSSGDNKIIHRHFSGKERSERIALRKRRMSGGGFFSRVFRWTAWWASSYVAIRRPVLRGDLLWQCFSSDR